MVLSEGSATNLRALVRTLHWRRGLRAGFAVGSAMLVCRALGRPMGWAALGGFEAVLVDNGGPYRSRVNTVASVLFGGALCGLIGSLVPLPGDAGALMLAALITAGVCFAVTFGRVASQPIANTSVIILVIYFAGYGSAERSVVAALGNVGAYILGGLWAAALSLFLWPVDPFRPARLEVAACYDLLAEFTTGLHAVARAHAAHDDDHDHAVDFKRKLRMKLESARAALGASPARAPARTHRARNLSVLLETADMLFAATLRLNELAEIMGTGPPFVLLEETSSWLSGAERAVADALRSRPADRAASFGADGSHRIEFVARPSARIAGQAQAAETSAKQIPGAKARIDSEAATPGLKGRPISGASFSMAGDVRPLQDREFSRGFASPFSAELLAEQHDALANIEIAFEALRALWTGVDIRPGRSLAGSGNGTARPISEAVPGAPVWLDALRQNWTTDSTMMRHALRMAVVGAADVLLMRAVHVSHGFWLAMTSIIVLQPHSSGTLRKGLERVGGTIAGGVLAALIAAAVHSNAGIIAFITVSATLALATYAIDYGWYSFFLTPTFILLSLPHLRDWRYAGVRIVTTMLGALTAVLAMRVLWPQSLSLELSGLLARCAEATSSYLRATLLFWQTASLQGAGQDSGRHLARTAAERDILAPARRACGLASQDAEEAVDRAMLDPLPASSSTVPATESALTFTTYIRRFTQCLTTLAAVGVPTPDMVTRLNRLVCRLDESVALLRQSFTTSVPERETSAADSRELAHFEPSSSLAEQMLQRMERQAGVLERAAAAVVAPAADRPS